MFAMVSVETVATRLNNVMSDDLYGNLRNMKGSAARIIECKWAHSLRLIDAAAIGQLRDESSSCISLDAFLPLGPLR
ncbi:MAG: hypothetical protein EBU08_20335, partial [Micrococcales bacterium]|nr:hypothetical protein [Micrococcales bacterium]